MTYNKFLRAGFLALSVASVAGCSSMNVGESDFACAGMPGDFTGGDACRSAYEIYEMTNNGEVPDPVIREPSKNGVATAPQGRLSTGPNPDTSDFVTPALPNRPVPVRTPAQVMRLWVSPWEDTAGNLNVPGYVYTEIEPRRWTIADTAPTTNPALRPLQMGPSSTDTRSD